ncbi:MAG: anti-sigma factor [Actinobacteria bacterium]|nr:anti-sigma factor [Actinomycetota bacterium]
MTSDKELGNLSGSYALNGLDAADLAEFETHLQQSQATRDEVTELTDTAVLLGLAVEPVQPSAGLKASIMDQLDAHPQLPVAAASSAAFASPAGRKAQARWFTRPVTALAAVAAAIALFVGGGVITTSLAQNSFAQQQADQLAAINSADDAQRASVDLADGGTATLVWSNTLLSSALIVDGLAPLPADRTYELWYINDAGARPAGTFGVAGSGSTWRVLDGTMKAGDTVGVTVEPRGGSDAPTTDPVVVIASA